jgi:hypothetical protein
MGLTRTKGPDGLAPMNQDQLVSADAQIGAGWSSKGFRLRTVPLAHRWTS